jgi:predicted aldo/keto reductase-like oxidoreductase
MIMHCFVKGYGSSQLQFGPALSKHPRESYILQTKISAKEDPEVFRKALDDCLRLLQV